MLPKTAMARISASVSLVLLVALLGFVAWSEWFAGSDAESGIGGPYELVNTQGETVTPASFDGQYRLIYFGYTHCPSVCPQTANAMSRALDHLAEKAPQRAKAITPVFITIDPDRDDGERLAAWLDNFHQRFVGLTGSDGQIRRAAEQFRVTYEKRGPEGFEEGSTMAEQAKAKGYLMQHSSYVFLMGPDGQYVDHVSTNAGATQITRMLTKHVAG
ncbi:protein SCO1/2 [Limimonas halophila]|uniref:Protein SCO1/2 n=1 Tax=Limimonas halophila TaxID=1082479 RepID=A0A1G7UCD4_9PROT|nr:SCO family protein [Limimonas halophila]SDG44410.1 protein SCO1/2 [Limimonas halophila]